MGGAKQNYIITYQYATGAEEIYLSFGNGKYAKDIFRALGVYYESFGYTKELNEKDWFLILTKQDEQGEPLPEETILFKLYQKQLMWRGQLPEDLAFLEELIPQTT